MSGRRRKIALALLVAFIAVLCAAGLIVRQVMKVEAIFEANETLKNEGYYLSEFEFRMLAAAYYLDHGQYLRALSRLDQMHTELTKREGLVKVPEFSNAEEKLDFYQSLQNPETGAFYPNADDPVFAYFGVTANMINLIEDLSRQAGKPFSLDHPLHFLEEIDTPEKLTTMLDDVSQVGWIGARFKAPFVSAIELRDLIEQGERLGVHSFSPEFRHAFLQWFYDNQDPETGLWGARDRASGKIIGGGDVGDSGKVIKMFVDNQGNDIQSDFPLRYADRIFASSIERLSEPMPSSLDDLHRWILTIDRGFRFLTRYVWQKGSPQDRETVRGLLKDFIAIRFERYFVESDGAFSLYPDAGHADLDGTGEAVGMYDYIGALSEEKQARLWGEPVGTTADLGRRRVSTIRQDDIAAIATQPEVNSIRFYTADPAAGFLQGAKAVHYPEAATALDLVDLVPRLTAWLEQTRQTMGNWVRRDSVLDELAAVNIDPAPVSEISEIDSLLQANGELIAIGFDALQVPRYRIVYERE